ncbi:unnamed protein product [Effrenium voratum]|uniref:Uncharacterized protein n=1 Tax=Effrenium voratum TaxID=2562239 RepID=A0AA36JLE5_9DINO|nr:unnamed protein product [Effrenium voratum]
MEADSAGGDQPELQVCESQLSPAPDFSFSKDRCEPPPFEPRETLAVRLDLLEQHIELRFAKLAEEVAAERLSRSSAFSSLSERLEAVAAQAGGQAMGGGHVALASAMLLGEANTLQPPTPTRDPSPRVERLVDERIKVQSMQQAAATRDLEVRLATLSRELSSAVESHRGQVVKVTQAVGELGREISVRLDRLETECLKAPRNLEESRNRLEELSIMIKTQGITVSKQEAAVSSIRDDLKNEQRIRKEEIHSKLRELAARPLRPEELGGPGGLWPGGSNSIETNKSEWKVVPAFHV